MTPDDVFRASNAWVWVPDGAPTVETEEYLLVRFPDHHPIRLGLVRFTPQRAVPEVVDEVLDRARAFGLPELVWNVRLDAPDGAELLLRDRGGVLEETLDVFALDLSPGVPDLGQPDVELRWAVDVETARDAHRVEVEVFGGAMPDDEQLHREAAREAVGMPVGRGGTLVAYLDGEPAGAGGLASRGPAAGLHGGAVREPYRRRGVYRALLAERLAYAAGQYMTMALVKGRVQTSGPILRRAGFGSYGQERTYRVPLR